MLTLVRAGDEPHRARRPPAPDRAEIVELDVTDAARPRRARRARRRPARRRAARHRLRARVVPRRRLPRRAVGRRRRRAAGVGVLAQGARRRVPAADGPAAARSSASTSTTAASPGRSTTGWAWPRRRSSRPRATSPATSARRASASTSSPPARCARSRRKSIPGFEQFEDVWDERAPLGWDVKDPEPVARGVRRAALRLVPGDHRRDRPRRRRLPRGRRLSAPDHLVRVRNCPGDHASPTRGPVAGGLW